MIGFEALREEFGSDEFTPNGLENFYYFFFEQGLSLADIAELPIPYLWNVYMTGQYHAKKMQEKNEGK